MSTAPTPEMQAPGSVRGDICGFTFDEYHDLAKRFHGYAAPGLLLGGFMVHEARSRLPESILFDAVAETSWCLPDAIQMLTPCTVGNGWLRIFNLGLYALSLYDKSNGRGVRVAVDPGLLGPYPCIAEWLLKLKPKKQQDSDRLREEIRLAGASVCSVREVSLRPEFLGGRGKGSIAICPTCGQAYPARDGSVCRACLGESPYARPLGAPGGEGLPPSPVLRAVPPEQAVGKTLVHDMTRIEPGRSKGAAFLRGQVLDVGDVCRLHKMGRSQVFVEDAPVGEQWVHEDDAALAMAGAMAGDGVESSGAPREGKVTMTAARDGLLAVDAGRLELFNSIPGVMCATRQDCTVVKKGQALAGTRAIPLYLERPVLERALAMLQGGPVLTVLPMAKPKAGILVTGTEVFQGLVEDRFIPIISAKLEAYGCPVAETAIVPDDREAIADSVRRMVDAGVELLVTTAGLSVDPDDVTRHALADAGAEDMLYGAPLLPGAMTLLARVGRTALVGVPACALYFKTTSFDLLLPRLLAGLEVTRQDLAAMGHGGFCLNCKLCTYPKCAFGK